MSYTAKDIRCRRFRERFISAAVFAPDGSEVLVFTTRRDAQECAEFLNRLAPLLEAAEAYKAARIRLESHDIDDDPMAAADTATASAALRAAALALPRNPEPS